MHNCQSASVSVCIYHQGTTRGLLSYGPKKPGVSCWKNLCIYYLCHGFPVTRPQCLYKYANALLIFEILSHYACHLLLHITLVPGRNILARPRLPCTFGKLVSKIISHYSFIRWSPQQLYFAVLSPIVYGILCFKSPNLRNPQTCSLCSADACLTLSPCR